MRRSSAEKNLLFDDFLVVLERQNPFPRESLKTPSPEPDICAAIRRTKLERFRASISILE